MAAGARDNYGGELRRVGYRDGLGAPGVEFDLTIARALGSTLIAQSFPSGLCSTTFNLTNSQAFGVPIWLEKAYTLTGAVHFQATTGAYTANANTGNLMGLYTSDGTNLTRVAVTGDTGSIWKGTASTYVQTAFTSTYSASAGLYWLVGLWNRTAVTTTPVMAAGTSYSNAAVGKPNNTSVAFNFTLASQTSMPSSIAWSSVTAVATQPWLGVY